MLYELNQCTYKWVFMCIRIYSRIDLLLTVACVRMVIACTPEMVVAWLIDFLAQHTATHIGAGGM